jgi:hypothetical protein
MGRAMCMWILLGNVTFDLEPLGFVDGFRLRKPYNLIAKMKLHRLCAIYFFIWYMSLLISS